MVAHFTMRTYGVNQAFQFVEGIWLHRKSRHIRFFFRKRPILLHTCATCSELTSYIRTMHNADLSTMLYIFLDITKNAHALTY